MAEEQKSKRGRKKGQVVQKVSAGVKDITKLVNKLPYTELQELSAIITDKLDKDKAEQIAVLEKQLKELKTK